MTNDLPYGTSVWGEGGQRAVAPLGQDLDVDVAIIGAGFVGLSSAVALSEADPSLRIAVLEAEHVGSGASGRGSGMVAPLLHGIGSVARVFGWDEVRWAARFLIEEGARLGDFIREESIACDYEEAPLATIAVDDRQGRWLDGRTAELHRAGYATRRLGPEELGRFVGYPAKAAAITEEANFGRLQPLALAQGFAEASVRKGVGVYEKTVVKKYEASPRGIRIITEAGARVAAKKLVLAAGVRIRELGYRRLRPFPMAVQSYLLATDPLDASELERLGVGLREACILDASPAFYYLRTYRDRLLIGGASALFSKADDKADRDFKRFETVRTELHRRFPFLRETPVTAAWAGPIQSNLSELPTVRTLPGSPDVVLNIAYVNGVPLSCLAGRMIVDLVLGPTYADRDVERLRNIFNGTSPSIGELARFGWSML